jgi:hypothetical protein
MSQDTLLRNPSGNCSDATIKHSYNNRNCCVEMTTGPWIIRRAQASDLDALTWIAINAFRQDPQWNYRYPHATEFPDDHLEYTRRRYAVWLEANETPRCIIMVAEWRDPEDPVPKTVAMSIWRIPGRACSANGGVHSRSKKPPVGKACYP